MNQAKDGPMQRKIIAVIVCFVFFSSIVSPPVFAAALTKANTATMNAAADWGGSTPTSSDVGTFDNTISAGNIATLSLGSDVALGGLVFANNMNDAATIASGNTLTLGTSGIDMSAANEDVTINSDVALSGNQGIEIAEGRTLTFGGNVDNGGNTATITLHGDNAISAVAFSGVISGTGGLTVIEADANATIAEKYAKITFSGAESNTYTGTTFLSGNAAGDGRSITLYLNKTGGATAIAGAITLDNTGGNTIKCLQDNQFSSTNTVITWTTSAGGWSGQGRLELNGHDQTVAGLVSPSNSDDWPCIQDGGYNDGEVGDATLTINTAAGQTYTFYGRIRDHDASGSANDELSIVKTGAGTQVIDMDHSGQSQEYTGTTTISEGTFQLGTGGTTGKLDTSSQIITNGTFAVNRSNTVTQGTDFYSGAISGTGGVTQAGTGTLILNVANTYTGTTSVAAGTLKLGAAGVIADTSALDVAGTFDMNAKNETVGSLAGAGTVTSSAAGAITLTVGGDNTSTTFSGLLEDGSGTVSLTKAGTGTMTLSGANTYAGTTTLSSGTLLASNTTAFGTSSLVLGGSSAEMKLNTAALTVTGGIDANTGTLNLQTGTVTVGGTTDFASGTTIASTIGASSNGKISNGASDISITLHDGAIISLTPTSIQLGNTYTLIDATGASGGSNLAVTAANITVDESSVRYAFPLAKTGDTLTTTPTLASGITSSPVNAVVDSGLQGDSLLSTINGLSNANEVNTAMESLEPDTDTIKTSTMALQSAALQPVENRISGFQREGVASGDIPTLSGIWAQGFYENANQNDVGDAYGYASDMSGFALGCDREWDYETSQLLLGVAYSKLWADVDINRVADQIDVDGHLLTGYGAYEKDNVIFDLKGTYGLNFYETSRNIVAGSVHRIANADFDGHQWSLDGDMGYRMEKNGYTVMPKIGLKHMLLYTDAYKETGAGSASLNVDSDTYNKLYGKTEIAADKTFTVADILMSPKIKIGFMYDFLDEDVSTTAAFQGGGSSFSVKGLKPERYLFTYGAEIAIAKDENLEFNIGYDFSWNQEYYSNYFTAKVRYEF